MTKKEFLPPSVKRSSGISPTSKEELPSQIVMDFFNQGIPITQAPRDIALKKSNAAIKMNSTLGLLELKIIDASLFIAKPQINENVLHSTEIEYFKWLLNFNSKNHEHLKRAITKIQQTLIQISIVDEKDPSKDVWHSTSFIHDVTIANGRLYFRIPESLRQPLADPHSYTYLSLKIKNTFTSEYAYRLYERCKADQFKGGATEWWTIDEFRKLMNTTDLYANFKEFNRRVIKAAMQQINDHSDIYITDIYQTQGRSKTHIRFIIEDSPNLVKFAHDKEKMPAEIFNALKDEFGFSNSQIDDVAKHPLEYLAQKIEFTRYRIKTAKNPINRPDAYLLKALKEDLRFNEGEIEKFEIKKKQNDIQVAEETKKHKQKSVVQKRNDQLDAFYALGEDEKEVLLNEFKASTYFDPIKKALRGKNFSIENPMVKIELMKFLSDRQH